MGSKLPLHTRLGFHITGAILVLLCFFMLKNCVQAVYYSDRTTGEQINNAYKVGFTSGLTGNSSAGLPVAILSNPLLVKMYQKGFRDGRDRKGERKRPMGKELLIKEEK